MTELKKISIKGFKSIKELVDFDLTNLNVFIGANGAGKSNLIEFFVLPFIIDKPSLKGVNGSLCLRKSDKRYA